MLNRIINPVLKLKNCINTDIPVQKFKIDKPVWYFIKPDQDLALIVMLCYICIIYNKV